MKNTYYLMSFLAASLALTSCISDNEGWGRPRVHRSTDRDSVLTETTATKPTAMDMLVANSSRISQTQPKPVYNTVEPAPVLPPLPAENRAPKAMQEPTLDTQLIETEVQEETTGGSWTQQQPAPEVQTPVPAMPQTPVSEVQPEPVVKQAPQPKQESPTVGEVAQNQPTAAAQQPKQEPVKPVVKEAPKPQPTPVRKVSAPTPTQQQPAATVQTRPVTQPVAAPAPRPVITRSAVAPASRPVMTPAQKKRYPVMPGQNRGLKLRD